MSDKTARQMILEDRLQRIAFARVISDLIEADFIVENDEMTFFEEINSRFHISRDMLVEAKRKSFGWASNILKSLDDGQKEAIKEVLRSMAFSDGTCVPQEALQIIAVLSVLDGKGEAFSITSGADFVENMKVIYVENSENSEVNRYIQDHYRSISNEFRLAGLDFVYIPKIVEDYRMMDEAYLRKSIGYMVPSLSNDKIALIQKELCSITTPRFCLELLDRKMGIRIPGNSPAFLFRIGESSVIGVIPTRDEGEKQIYSNYLKIDIEEDILNQVIGIVDTYRNLVNCTSYVEISQKANKFLYSGFHRSLFDLIAFGKPRADYRVIINIGDKRKAVITFRSLDGTKEDEVLELAPQASALYILMIQQSVFGPGLIWKENLAKEEKTHILDKFNKIYTSIGKREKQNEYKDRILVSRIKKELKKRQFYVTNIDSFIPELRTRDNTSTYAVPAMSDLIYVVQNGAEIRMEDSDFWRNL